MSKKISLLEAIAMAVGTMIGASIFSIFGVGAKIAGHNLPEAFILSGVFAFLVAYSYGKLGAKIVSNAGPIAFILKGIGDNIFTGALSILMWLSYVVSISLFAKGFTGYFLPLFHFPLTAFSAGITEIVLIAFFTALNFFGSKAVGKVEFYIVFVKLSILGLFILLGSLTIHSSYIVPSFNARGINGIVNAAIIFFLSYMGFGLVTNASENMENPRKNVPKAIYISIAVVMFVYVAVALVAIGNLTIPQLIKAQDNALAVAARPFLGSFGFILISVGALFSISSALNATIYGGANISYSLAKDGELPELFERKVWFKSTEGLYITAALGLVFAIFFNISAIASITSGIFTMIYIFVLFSHIRLINRKIVEGQVLFVGFNLVVMMIIFLALLFYQWQTQKSAFYGLLLTLLGALLVEFIYRNAKRRKFKNVRPYHENS